MLLFYDPQTGSVTSYAGIFFVPGVDEPPTRHEVDSIQPIGASHPYVRVYNPQVMHTLWQHLGVRTPLRVASDAEGEPKAIMATVVEDDVPTEVQLATIAEATSDGVG